MINNNYLIDTEWCDSGGYCDFLPIKEEPSLGFKSFKVKKRAEETCMIQKKLSQFDLAPKILTEVCKVPYFYNPSILKYWNPEDTITSWGYVTEKAVLLDEDEQPYRKLQNLVNNIKQYVKIKFWDCHWSNVGYIKRGNRNKLVCIDTGKESFDGDSNAWGFEEPGPICPYCEIFECSCVGEMWGLNL